MEGKVDARILKTREKLKKALLELMKDNAVETINVTTLCRKAGVNRNTFYAHYLDPIDLLKEIESELLESMWNTLSQVDTSTLDLRTFINSILYTINDNRELCYLILSPRGGRHFVNTIVTMLRDKAVASWRLKGMTEEEADYTYHYCVGGALGVIESWAMGGYRVEVAVLGDMLSGLIENGRIRNIRRY